MIELVNNFKTNLDIKTNILRKKREYRYQHPYLKGLISDDKNELGISFIKEKKEDIDDFMQSLMKSY